MKSGNINNLSVFGFTPARSTCTTCIFFRLMTKRVRGLSDVTGRERRRETSSHARAGCCLKLRDAA